MHQRNDDDKDYTLTPRDLLLCLASPGIVYLATAALAVFLPFTVKAAVLAVILANAAPEWIIP